MALPVAWTEASLIGEMTDELEAVAAPFDLDSKSLIERAVKKDVPEVLKVSSVAAVTYGGIEDVVKVLTIARWKTWERAYQVTLPNVRITAGPSDLYQSEAWEHLKDYLGEMRATALQYSEVQAHTGGGSMAYVSAIGTVGNPYPFRAYSDDWS